MRQVLGFAPHALWVAILTILTQIGGVAWLLALLLPQRWLAFPLLYATLWLITMWIAPLTSRVPLPCSQDGPLQLHNAFYCAANRHYVTPTMAAVAQDLATAMAREFPGTQTYALDGGFPYLTGFPLLPHLSHDDGEKLDLALFWKDQSGPSPLSKSSIGYWGFAQGPSDCPSHLLTLRWNMAWWPTRPLTLDTDRTRFALTVLSNDTRVSKILLEPHIKQQLGLVSDKIRFQGCRAARHDDHIHLQL